MSKFLEAEFAVPNFESFATKSQFERQSFDVVRQGEIERLAPVIGGGCDGIVDCFDSVDKGAYYLDMLAEFEQVQSGRMFEDEHSTP
jgi:hypothetical protein